MRTGASRYDFVAHKHVVMCNFVRSTHVVRVPTFFLLQSFSFQTNLGSLGAVIWLGDFLEPRMIQGLLGCDPVCRIVHKDLLQQIEEVFEEGIIRGNNILSQIISSEPCIFCQL